jgi:hypothetical protein
MATKKSLIELAEITQGHIRLLRRMGLRLFTGDSTAEAAEAMSEDERSREVVALIWLLTRPRADLLSGGAARQAIDAGTWETAVEDYEMELTPAHVEAIGPALAALAARSPGPA